LLFGRICTARFATNKLERANKEFIVFEATLFVEIELSKCTYKQINFTINLFICTTGQGTDYESQMEPFFIEMPNFWARTDKLGR
jgi:hypothetical protein